MSEYFQSPISKMASSSVGYLFGYKQGEKDGIRKVLDDAKKLLDKITPDKVAEIKCDDGEIRNRPLIDIAKVYEILEQMKGEQT